MKNPIPKRLRTWLPNTSDQFSLVGTSKTSAPEPDFRAYWPVRLTQIVGGKRWSLSVVWHKTPHPVLAPDLFEQVMRDLRTLSKDEFESKYYSGDYA